LQNKKLQPGQRAIFGPFCKKTSVEIVRPRQQRGQWQTCQAGRPDVFAKMAQNVAQTIFCQILTGKEHKRMAKYWTLNLIFKNLPEEKNLSIGENSPNPVTLLPSRTLKKARLRGKK
jgi:hypothetical protein